MGNASPARQPATASSCADAAVWQPAAVPVPASSSGAARGWAYVPNSTVADFISNSAILSWTLRISSGMTEGICKWMMQSDREFLNIWVSCGQ